MNHEERKQTAVNSVTRDRQISLEPEEEKIFAEWLSILNDCDIPYVVGGAFAIHEYTCIWRFTKDLDVFLRPDDLKKALDAISRAGFDTEVRNRYWLAKATREGYLLDLIFSLSSGYIDINDSWFQTSVAAEIAGVKTHLPGVEELIASKVYVTRSDRFDGADIVHIIEAVKGNVHWQRLLQILKEDSVLVLWHLILFAYVYPGHADYLPQELMGELFEKLRKGWSHPKDPKAFYGMMIDPLRFRVDVVDWGYHDERRMPGPLVDKEGNKI